MEVNLKVTTKAKSVFQMLEKISMQNHDIWQSFHRKAFSNDKKVEKIFFFLFIFHSSTLLRRRKFFIARQKNLWEASQLIYSNIQKQFQVFWGGFNLIFFYQRHWKVWKYCELIIINKLFVHLQLPTEIIFGNGI